MRLLSRSVLLASLALPTVAPDRFEHRLRRAALEQAAGNPWGVIEQLEPLDASPGASPDRDRAAFLLGHAYLELGGFTEFQQRFGAFAPADAGSPFAQWLVAKRVLLEADAGGPAASELLARHGSAPPVAVDSTLAAQRARLLAQAAVEMDGTRWEPAYAVYCQAATDWSGEHARLADALAERDYDALWAEWENGAAPGDALALDAGPLAAVGSELARAASNLASRAAAPARGIDALALPAAPASFVPAPDAGDWRAVGSLGRELSSRAFERDRAFGAVAREEARLAAQRRYFESGARAVETVRGDLARRSARLDSLARALASLRADLDSVRAQATRRVLARTQRVLERGAAHETWIAAMRHFHVVGPERERPEILPPGVPGPDSLTLAEAALTRRIRAFAERMAATAPDLIARSDQAAWGPNLLDRVRAQALALHAQLADAQALASAIDSTLATLSTSEARERLALVARGVSAEVDSLATAHREPRARVAEKTVRAALAALDAEREAIDYGLATASYGASVRAVATDSSARTIVGRAADGAAAGGNASRAAELPADDPASAEWRARAIAHSDEFLARYPASPERPAMRFQLADLLLVDARHDFRDAMAAFLAAQEAGRSGTALPVLEHARPLALYRSILAEDSSFVHRDAVLFNAGSILAEEGDAAAEGFFQQLVTAHPASPLAQEAHLRIGDLRFDGDRYAEAVEPYALAAAGAEANLRLVALYMLGWAQFNRERFLDAADAFRGVLDLYDGGGLPAGAIDVRRETEAFLIHTFARAGGADAFAAYFERVGARPYAPRLLMAMGQHFRRFSLYTQAARADSLHLERYALEADALVSAERLAATYGRADRAARALEARERYAPRFAPESAWARAQASDSVRAAGAAFARSSWAAIALFHQRKAARDGSRDDWQDALANYRTLIARWPDDPEAALFAFNAGEACAALGDDAAALEYYATAARAGRDSIPELALRQRLAVTDAAYERTRGVAAKGAGATGSDSLAHAVLAAGDDLLTHSPAYTAASTVRWREGNLAFAHGWYERAERDFESLVAHDPSARQAPFAAGLRAEALFRLERYDAAGEAFEVARATAQRAGNDMLALRAAHALPVCAFRLAEAAVRADSSAHERHARLFADVAARWPAYEHAPLAQYRAGLAYRRAGKYGASVEAMEALLRAYPKSEFARDAQLSIAQAWKEAGENAQAAEAYVAFARRFPKDESANEAHLQAADLYAAAGLGARADTLRLAYVRAHPEDVATGMTILEDLARRELAQAGDAPRPHLADYLKRAAAHPDLASKPLLAEVRYREGEAARAAYEAVRLTLPLQKSIALKHKHLDGVLASYRKSVDLGVTEWAQASAFRIGEALVAFGQALDQSERPAGLAGDDLRAYEEVLFKESQGFYDRGEGVWADVLSHRASDAPESEWITRSQTALWKRLGNRFLFKAEVDFPLVAARGPSKSGAPSENTSAALDAGAAGEPAREAQRP